MSESPLASRILVVDDTPQNIRLLEAVLLPRGYEVIAASSGEEALQKVAEERPDLVLLDVLMPGLNGHEVCRRLRADPATRLLPVVMVTASGPQEKLAAIEAGADDFVQKPFDRTELLARVKSLLRIKSYHDTIQHQAAELAELNRSLERRVQQQVEELERVGRLRRFLSPRLVELIVSSGDESCLASHRRQITVVFCDLRGFTAFAERAEPEEIMAVLAEYHAAVGEVIHTYQGTLEHFAGDGVMAFFNDPLPQPDHIERAVRAAVAMRERVGELVRGWREQDFELDLGVGIAVGYATLGQIGFEGRFDYAAIGTVTNLAARLCGEAAGGQILINARAHGLVEQLVEAEPLGELTLKGFSRPVAAFNVTGFKSGGQHP